MAVTKPKAAAINRVASARGCLKVDDCMEV